MIKRQINGRAVGEMRTNKDELKKWQEIEQTTEYREAYSRALEEGLNDRQAKQYARDNTAHLLKTDKQ